MKNNKKISGAVNNWRGKELINTLYDNTNMRDDAYPDCRFDNKSLRLPNPLDVAKPEYLNPRRILGILKS